LMRGCTPRVPPSHRAVLTARLEVAAGKVCAIPREPYLVDVAVMGHPDEVSGRRRVTSV
jgi:hypothetical protein